MIDLEYYRQEYLRIAEETMAKEGIEIKKPDIITFTTPYHGLQVGDAVQFQALVMPDWLKPNTTYYVGSINQDSFTIDFTLPMPWYQITALALASLTIAGLWVL